MAAEIELNLTMLTADLVASYVTHHRVGGGDVAVLIVAVHGALAGLGVAVEAEAEAEPAKPERAVTIRKSLASPDRILSMIDGKPYTVLTRHIGKHGYTPKSYRETFGLPADYPMTAPAYSVVRRAMSGTHGFSPKVTEAAPPARRGRKPGGGQPKSESAAS